MKKRSLLLVLTVVACATLFGAAMLIAGTTVPDDIVFKPVAGKGKYQDRIVSFSHKKHSETYKIGCGDCHHDANNKPLTNLKAGDDVQKCTECHKLPGEAPKKGKKKLKGKEARAYMANAFHDNCYRSCHRDYNKKNKTKAAPTSCTKCHKKP